jgi:hypothetical protein
VQYFARRLEVAVRRVHIAAPLDPLQAALLAQRDDLSR